MTAHVISHRRPRRKRGNAWAYAGRRFGALVLTLAALTTASWLAPMLRTPADPLLPELVETRSAEPGPEAALFEVDIALDLLGPPPPPQRQRRRERGVPLDAAANHVPDGYEILSAAELAAISQASD